MQIYINGITLKWKL